MASYAGGNSSRLGQVMDSAMLRGEQGGEKSKKAYDIIQRHLAEGGALSKGLTKKFMAKGDRNEFLPKYEATFGPRDGKEPAAVAGMRGLELPEGAVYLGSAAVTTPGSSSRTRNGGHTSTPGRTTYAPGFMSGGAFRSLAARQEEPSSAPAGEQKPYEPSPDLAPAREAYQRAMAYQEGSGSAAAPAFDANLQGGDLLNNIYAQGDTYKKRFDRFLDQQDKRSRLIAAEIGDATQGAIAGLSPDIKVPEYTDPFRETGYGKRGDQTLFGYLRKQVTA